MGADTYELTGSGMYVNGVLQAAINGSPGGIMASTTTVVNNPLDVSGVLGYTETHTSGPSTGTNDDLNWNPQIMGPICKSNKKDKDFHVYGDTRFKIKVAINSTWIRASAKGKVVHFKKKNGNWKRKRTKMAVYVGGWVYNNECNDALNFSERDPYSGWKKRKQLKVKRWQPGAIWRTNPLELGANYLTESGYQGGVILNW